MPADTTISILVDEKARRDFERTWHEGQPEPIDRFLPEQGSSLYLGTLLELVQIEMELAWKSAGKPDAGAPKNAARPRVEDYLGRYPKLADAGMRLTLVRHEFDVRKRLGDSPAIDEYRKRFPDLIVTGGELSDADDADETKQNVLPDVPGYQLLGLLGHGGMGVVYRARQLRLKRDVALKMLSSGPLARQDEMARFLAEAESVARLQHPHIVQIFEVGEWQGRPYLALELVNGGSLAQRLKSGPLPAQRAAQWMQTLALTMQHVHEHGIVHRDLKPANILITRDGVLKITDFGLAKRLGEAGSHTLTGAVMGTASYTSPEQAAGKSYAVGPPADIYGLGAILYEMLTGRPPFQAESAVDTILQVLKDEPVSITRLRPRISRDLETICHKCLQKEPHKRYATAGDLAEDLRRFVAGEPILARPTGRLGRAWRWARRNPGLAILGTVTATALLAAAIVSTSLAIYHAHAETVIRGKESQIEAALQQAQVERNRAQELAARVVLDQSIGMCLQGDTRSGLLSMIHSLDLAPADAAQVQWAARAQLDAWSREVNSLRIPPLNHEGSIDTVAFNRDGSIIATGSEDQNAILWDAVTGNIIARPLRHGDAVRTVSFSPDGSRLLTGSDDGNARVFNARSGEPVFAPLHHDAAVRCAMYTPNGKTIATGSWDGTARLWNAETGAPITPPLQAGAQVIAMAISPNGELLATAAKSEVRIWHVATGQPVGLTLRHPRPVAAVAFNDDGRLLATGCAAIDGGGEARIWDVASSDQLGQTLTHPDRVSMVQFQPGGGLLATGSDDGSVRLWNAATGASFGVPLRHREQFPIRAIAFSHNGRMIATGSADNTVRIWDADLVRPIGTNISLEGSDLAVAFSPDDSALLTAGNDKTARLWSIASGQAAVKPMAIDPIPGRMAMSADGHFRLIIESGSSARLVSADTGQPLGPPLQHPDPVGEVISVALSRDGTIALTGGKDLTARLWEARTGKPIGTPLRHPGTVRAAALSPDGKLIATGCDDKMVRIWDLAGGQQIGTKPLQQRGPVLCLAFSPDSRLLLAGCAFPLDGEWRGQARIWDVTTRTSIGQAMRHPAGITAAAFSPDGRIAVTGSRDRTACFWDTASGRQIGPALENPGEVTSAFFSPDGRLLTTLSSAKAAAAKNVLPATAPATSPATAPAREDIILANWACIWRTPVAVEGAKERLAVWAQVITGAEVDTTNLPHRIDDETWRARKQKLDSLGGPPGQ